MPITLPPWSRHPLANAPIKPLFPPPYTNSIFSWANRLPRAAAADKKLGLLPDFEPQKTVSALIFIKTNFNLNIEAI